jgi:LPXTG-motif cell wall-anchored protein
MTTSTTVALAFLGVLALVALGFWLYRRGRSTGAAEKVRDDAAKDEARAVTEATAKADTERAAIDARAREELKTDALADLNERLRRQ